MALISPTTGLNDLSGIFLLQSAQTFHKNGQFRPIRGIVLAAERRRRRASETHSLCFEADKVLFQYFYNESLGLCLEMVSSLKMFLNLKKARL